MTSREAVVRRLNELFEQWSDEQALQFTDSSPDGAPAQCWHSWGDIGALAASLSRAVESAGVAAASAVAIVMRQRPAMAGAELAVLSTGRTALLITPLQSDDALAVDLVATAAAVVVAHTTEWERPGVADAIAESGAVGIELDDEFGVRVRVEPDVSQHGPALDAAVTVLTSGTTGPPKRLPVAWETFVDLGGGPDGREPKSNRGALILSLPLVTLGGLLSMARLVFMGRPMSMTERFDVHTWAALVKQHRPKVMGAPPPVVKMILDADISPDHFEGVTAYMTSSAAIAPEVIRAFEARYGIPVLLGYGATEFLNSVSGWTMALWEEFGATKVGSVGRAHPGVQLRVVDGVLEVDPPQRAENLPAGWLRTADRARIDEDGFLWILGRVDGLIVRGGFKVDLSQIDRALLEHPAVSAACTVGLPDDRLGEVPASMVVAGPDVAAGDLVAWVRDRVAPYAVPTIVRIVDRIPQTSTFKPHRARIRSRLIAATEGDHRAES